VTITIQYIAGHQDDFTWLEDQPVLACLNIQVDSMGKRALQSLEAMHAPPLLSPFPGEAWLLCLHGMPSFGDHNPAILDHFS